MLSKPGLSLLGVLFAVGCQQGPEISGPPESSAEASRDPFSSTESVTRFHRTPRAISLAGTHIVEVDPSTLTCSEVIDFENLPPGGGSGTSHDGIVSSGVGMFAERFVGQALSFDSSFDVLSSTASSPLALQVGAPGQNVNSILSGGTIVIDGLGPIGFPSLNALGEGSIAGLFDADQFELGIEITGVNGGGSATLNFFRRDGSTIETLVLPLASNGDFAFRRIGDVADIAGLSIHNDDPFGLAYDNIVLCDAVGLEIEIDIRPGASSNPINLKSMGVVPVAILGSDVFDVTDVDVTSLAFGPDGASPRHDLTDPGVFSGHLQDVNGDGFTDLVSHYRQKETGLVAGDTTACIVGATLGGTPFEGCDSVRVLTK